MKMKRSVPLCIVYILLHHGHLFGQSLDVARWFGPQVGGRPTSIRYSADIYRDEDVENQDTELGLTEHNLSIMVPVWQNTRNELGLFSRVELQDIDTDAVLLKDGTPLPAKLWEVAFGGTYRGILPNNWLWGITASVGSASDEPFRAGDAFDGSLGGLLRIPRGERDAWLFFLYFATNREFLNYVPLPGFGYWWQPSDKFTAVVGIPFASFRYRPINGLTINASYFPARNVTADANIKIYGPCSAFMAFAWRNQRYFRDEREDREDRLFYYEKRIRGGLRFDIIRELSVKLEAGWAFDRFYFEAENFEDRDENRIDVDDGPFGAAMISLRF